MLLVDKLVEKPIPKTFDLRESIKQNNVIHNSNYCNHLEKSDLNEYECN